MKLKINPIFKLLTLACLLISYIMPVNAIENQNKSTSLHFKSSDKSFIEMDSALTYIPNTIETRVKIEKAQNRKQIIFGNYRSYVYPKFSLELTDKNELLYYEQINENGKTITCKAETKGFIINNEWTHIAVVRDTANQKVSILVNGKELVNKKHEAIKEKTPVTVKHFVGTDHRKDNEYFFDGEINSISLWNQTKSKEEVVADMNKELIGTEEGLYHAWKYDENNINDAAGTIYDLVAENKINATISGFEIVGQKIQILRERLIKYEELIKTTNADSEKKAAFSAVINKVTSELDQANTVEKINALLTQLENAYSDFGKPDDGKLNFVMVSDTHVESDESSTSSTIYDAFLSKIPTVMPNTKAVVNLGDLTNDGEEDEFKRYYEIIDKYDEQFQFVNALGNHDVRWKPEGWDAVSRRYMKYNQKYMGDTNKEYHDTWIGEGEDKYHFIVLNTEWDIKDSSYFSKKQLEWLDKTLAEGAKDDKPIFIVLHEPLRNTIANTNSYNGKSNFPLDEGPQDFELKEILRKYPQSVILTGHVHAGLGANEIVETEYGTVVNVPGFLKTSSGDPQNQLGYYVNVLDGKVQLSMYDFEHDKWLTDYHYTIDLTDKIPAGKVLDVTFDNETADDSSGKNNNGSIYGNVEFVDGVKGKAIHIMNDESSIKAKQYVDFGKAKDLQFGKDDFTIMFWYKGDKETNTNGAIISNKDLSSETNKGFSIASSVDPSAGIGLNFNAADASSYNTDRNVVAVDGEWHHIGASFDRDGMMTLYIDGKEANHYDISDQFGKSINADNLSLIIGADGNGQYPINDGYINELKIYKKVIEAYELESVIVPYTVKTNSTTATITWEDLPDQFFPAYILFNGEKLSIPENAQSFEIKGLKQNTAYSFEVITRDKEIIRNLVFAHEIEFKTSISDNVDKSALDAVIKKVEKLKKENYTSKSWNHLESILNEAKDVLAKENIYQKEINAIKRNLIIALDNLVVFQKPDKPVIHVEVPIIKTGEEVEGVQLGVLDKEKAEAILKSSILDDLINNASEDITITASIDMLDPNKSDGSIRKAIELALKEAQNTNLTIFNYFDLSAVIKEGDTVISTLNKAKEPITFQIRIPHNFIKEGREFYVVRVYEGQSDVLKVNSQDGFFTFSTDTFTTYALAYKDIDNTITTPEEPSKPADTPEISNKPTGTNIASDKLTDAPATSDSTNMFASMSVFAISTFACFLLIKRKKV